jgi:phosphodiesterase/alkaline phosphatase D-like protein
MPKAAFVFILIVTSFLLAAMSGAAPGDRVLASPVTHYAFGLSPWSSYDIYRDGTRVGQALQAGEQGTVLFRAEADGTYSFLPAGAPLDLQPPAAVADVAVVGSGDGSVSLSWTAPGDDGTTGTAYQYDLRYATTAINEANYASATPVSGESEPGSPGTSERVVVTGLRPGVTYHFALRTGDEALNWSPLSNSVSGVAGGGAPPPRGDTMPPSPVTNLAAGAATTTAVVLTWVAPGDDGAVGTAMQYDLRYSTSVITEESFAGATRVRGVRAPEAAGQAETATVTGLTAGTTYYFALKTGDEASNWSAISNVPSRSTAPTPPQDDTTPPATVADLVGSTVTETTIDLRWTAPGDDGATGTAVRYDLRYSTSVITEASFARATVVNGVTAPRAAGQTESFTVSGLAAATTYYFALKTADEVPNWSAVSNVLSKRTLAPPPPSDTAPPAAVTTLAAGTATTTTVTLTWTAPGDDGSSGTASRYDLRRSVAPITASNFGSATQVSGAPIPKAAGQGETLVVTGLTAATTYYFALKAADEVPNWSAISNVPSRSTIATPPPDDTTPPAAVTDLAAGIATETTIVLSWTARGDDGATGTAARYDLRYSTSVITEASFASATVVPRVTEPKVAGQTEAFAVTGLTAGTTYWFAVKTADEVPNWSAISNVPSKTTSSVPPLPPPPPADGTPPSTVRTLAAVLPTETGITLTWVAVGDDSTTGTAAQYDLRYAEAPVTPQTWNAATAVQGEPVPRLAGTPESFPVTGLLPGRTYYFVLVVVDEASNRSGLSNVAAGTTREAEPPPPPPDGIAPSVVLDLLATARSPREAVLRWTAPGDDGAAGTAAGYDVRRATGPINAANWEAGEPVACALAPRSSGEPETLRVTGLSPRSLVYFALRARDEAGNESSISNTVSVRTPAVLDTIPPLPVGDLTVTDSTETSVTLRWTAPPDSFPEGSDGTTTPASYDLRYATGDFKWETATAVSIPASAPGAVVRKVLDGLEAGTDYLVAVCLRDAAGNAGAPCGPVKARTVVSPWPPPPVEADTIPPSPVGELSVYATGPATLHLAWRAPGDDGTTGRAARYQFRWSLDPMTEDSRSSADSVAGLPAPAEPGTWEAFDWTGREPGTTYYLALRAVDEAGNGGPLTLAAAATPAAADNAPPAPPPAPEVIWADAAVRLRWDPSPDLDVVGYRVLRRRGDHPPPPQVVAELVPVAAWTDSTALAGIRYAYSVVAVDASGNASSHSAETVFLVPIADPGDAVIGIFPNPSAGRLRVVYARDAGGPTSLEVFDTAGRCLGRLNRESDPAGRSEWESADLATAMDADLPSGVYYARLCLGNRKLPARFVLRRGK